MDSLAFDRLEPKHLRWYQEIVQGGSLLLHRPGKSALHKGPDGISRNVEGRDRMLMAKSTEWEHYRERIKGVGADIKSGHADDEEAEALSIEQIER